MSIEAMKQALEALESVTGHFTRTPSTLRDSEVRGEAHKAIAALRQAIAEAEQAQPVAYVDQHGVLYQAGDAVCVDKSNILTPLYTATPQRKPLTDEEIAYEAVANNWDWIKFARAIEAKIKEKNT